MLKNKLYDSVKTYLDKYLFGFDKSQLEMSVLKGNINLNNVNVKPNKANKFLQSMMVPFALKAGTIGRLELKVSILQMWNGPVEIIIDDLFIILGPNYSMVSHDDSYVEEDEQHIQDPYDSSNMFNIFEHQLKLRKKDKDELLIKNQQLKRQNTQEQNQSEKQTFDFVKNMKLLINKVHIRYEDDVFNGEFPFSCGIVMDKLVWESTDQKWRFESLGQNKPTQSKSNNDPLSMLKNCIIENFRVYWNCMSEMYIPTSLWESTRHLKYQIFEAMEVSDLRGFLLQPFNPGKQNQFQYLISPTNITNQISYYKSEDKQNENTQISLIFTPFEINVTPRMVEDMNNLVELCQNYFLSRDLKQYRPHRKPITSVPEHLKNNPVIQRKRKLFVRDWFFYVVWFVRLKRILRNMYSTELLQQELEGNSKYSEILKILENPNSQISDLKRDFTKKSEQSLQDKSKFQRVMNLRCQAIKLNLYTKNIYETTHPKFQIETSQFSFETYQNNEHQNIKNFSGQMGELSISVLTQKNKRDYRQTKQSILGSSNHDQENTQAVSSFISGNNKTPYKNQEQIGRQNNFPPNVIQQNKNQFKPNNQLNAHQMRTNLQSPPSNHQPHHIPQSSSNPMVSPQQKSIQEEGKSLFGAVLSKVFGFGSTPDTVEKKQPELTSRKSDNIYEQQTNRFNDQYYQQSNSNNNSSILKQKSQRDFQQAYNPLGYGQMPNQQPNSTNNKNMLNSSRQGSGMIHENKVNSATKPPQIDLNELKNDPIHQFLMSDLSIKDLKSNMDNMNQVKAQRVQSSGGINQNSQRGYLQQQSTPQQLTKLLGNNGTNNQYQNNQMYKGLRDYAGKSQSQNNIPIPQNKKQPSSDKREIDQSVMLANSEIYKELSTTEVIVKQKVFTLQAIQNENNVSVYFSRSKTIPESTKDKSEYRLECQIGATNLCYSNETLGQFFDFIIEYQKLNVFRDIQIIHQFFETSQRRQTSAQRRLELIMPFYIIKKLVQNHQTGKIKDFLAQNNQAQKQKALSQWEQKLNTIDDQFRNFFFDISFQVAQSSIQLFNDNDQQFCKFSTPNVIQGQAYKQNHECGFDILGFSFQGCNSLNILSNFFHNLFNHVNMMKQHPAISRGVDFYENLHKNLKEKQQRNRKVETDPNQREKTFNQRKSSQMNKQGSQTKLIKYKQGPKAGNDENKNFIKIENDQMDPTTSKVRGGSEDSILQDFSNTPDQLIFFNRGAQGAQAKNGGLKQNLQLNQKTTSVIQNYNGNSADTIKVVPRIDQDPVYLQTEEYDEDEGDEGEPVVINDLDNLDDDLNHPQMRYPNALNLSSKNTIHIEQSHKGIGHNSLQPMQSNYSTTKSKTDNHQSYNQPSTISTTKGAIPTNQIREMNNVQPGHFINNNNNNHHHSMNQKESLKTHHLNQQSHQQQQKKGMPGQMFSAGIMKNDSHNNPTTNQFSSTGNSTKSMMNTGGSTVNTTSTPAFMGMVGRPMKTMNQIPSKQTISHGQQVHANKPGFGQGQVSINNHMQLRQR
ncbi:vacuolar protein sorting-associated protein 13a [Stylonychia lemnae]|uniref:Vacuolar protein sorting-associated protein 13a n=1 Tax=Stylonychia lemnae TaxID=5949 RepID=A0A078A902_STYLE|nr:vacuolar protein sorting-associated protein 13a [Stylonychia lemnae]|eukprot:CDW78351.1 vacuolar protein sorting-associated protein 13a [Stylonychia lemnae]